MLKLLPPRLQRKEYPSLGLCNSSRTKCILWGIRPHCLPELPTTTKLPQTPFCLPLLSGFNSSPSASLDGLSGKSKSNLCLRFCFKQELRLRPYTTLVHPLMSDVELGSHFCLTFVYSAVFFSLKNHQFRRTATPSSMCKHEDTIRSHSNVFPALESITCMVLS